LITLLDKPFRVELGCFLPRQGLGENSLSAHNESFGRLQLKEGECL